MMEGIVAMDLDAETAHEAADLKVLVPGLGDALARSDVIDVVLGDRTSQRPATTKSSDAADDVQGAVAVRFETMAAPDVDAFGGLGPGQRYILLRDVLQRVKDYRRLLGESFRRLAEDGWLVVTVPHQFLQERKFRRPSRHGDSAERFYTPGSLLFEVQEALDPTEYRVRVLIDDDAGYDYDAAIETVPAGHKRIVLALQRIARPVWAGDMWRGDDPRHRMDRPDRVIEIEPDAPVRQTVFRAESPGVDSVLVMKLDHRGDFLLSIPALTELRRAFPAARITLLCASWNEAVAREADYADEVIVFDFVAEDASADDQSLTPDVAARRLAEALGDRRFALAMDLSSHEKFRHLLAQIDARHRAGFDRWNKFPFLDIRLCLPNPSEEGKAIENVVTAADFNTRHGTHRRFVIDFTSRQFGGEIGEYLLWGPYQAFGAGSYRFEILVEALDHGQELGLEICRDQGTVRLLSRVLSVKPGETPTVDLSLLDHATDLEFRLSVIDSGPIRFRFHGVTFRREGATVGVHQLEAMFLLVQLASVRLSLPYSRTSFVG